MALTCESWLRFQPQGRYGGFVGPPMGSDCVLPPVTHAPAPHLCGRFQVTAEISTRCSAAGILIPVSVVAIGPVMASIISSNLHATSEPISGQYAIPVAGSPKGRANPCR